jgi:hypothetical protein
MKSPANHFERPARGPREVRTHYNLGTGGYTVDRWTDRPSGRCRQSSTRPPKAGKPRWLCDDDTVPALLLVGAYASYSRGEHARYLQSFEVVGTKPDGTPLRMGTRNVHAHVYGTPSDAHVDVRDGSWRPARYSANPPCFVDVATSRCLPNDRTVDVFLASAPNADGRRIYKARNRKPPAALPTMWWRPSRGETR